MSFTINFYINNSEHNRLNKSYSSHGTPMSGELKSETSIIKPSILVQGDLADYAVCNYMYISEFQRYYHITNIESIRTGLFQVAGVVDVLETYKGQIKNCSGILARQEHFYNDYIDDSLFTVESDPDIQVKVFPTKLINESIVLVTSNV